MTGPTDVTAARRALGAQLAQLRDAAGMTQHDLAPLVAYGRSTVANVEVGTQRVPRQFWVRCDDVFSTGGVLTEGYDRIETAQRQSAEAAARDLDATTSSIGSHPLQIMPDVDPDLVLHWSGMLQVLAASHNLFGPRQIHDAARRESAVIRRYRHDAVGSVKTGLLEVEARWAEFGSWTADNLGDRPAATHWLDRALALARRSGSGSVAAYVLMRQAQQAADRLDGTRAAALAETAATTAALTERDRALCAIRQAQGHALRGDRDACSTALKAAYRLVARADELGVDDDPTTIGQHCVLAYVRAHEAYCHLRTGPPGPAVRILEDVLADWPADYRQDEALARAWLALTYAALSRPAEAGAEGSKALALATSAWSHRALRTLGQLDARLATTAGLAEVATFRTAYSITAATQKM